MDRRQFLKVTSAAAAGSALLPAFLTRAAHAAQNAAVSTAYGSDTILVVVQMSGGNDGVNTVIPYGLDGYRANRPAIGIGEDKVLPLTERVGLHPDMSKLWQRYKAGQVAVIQGAGYPSPNLSHFRATDIWLTAVPDAYASRGWLGNHLNGVQAPDNMYAVSVTDNISPAFTGGSLNVPAIGNVSQYQFRVDSRYPNDRGAKVGYANWVYGLPYAGRDNESYIAEQGQAAMASTKRVQEAVGSYTTPVEYPSFPLANSLKTVAQLMSADLGTRIFYVQFGGFDTHSNQPNTQARLLGGFSNSVDAFFKDMERMGRNNVLLMTFSEFGRRVQENASQGTDHGTAAPMFVVGPRVEGGLYGNYPSLTQLDDNKNLKYQVDFRSVYGTVVEGWLGADQKTTLGTRYENVGFI